VIELISLFEEINN